MGVHSIMLRSIISSRCPQVDNCNILVIETKENWVKSDRNKYLTIKGEVAMSNCVLLLKDYI